MLSAVKHTKAVNILGVNLVESNVRSYSRVKMIEEDGVEDVYCLTIPDTGNFVANGIVVKNCIDAARYVSFTHKVSTYNPFAHNPTEFTRNKYQVSR